MKYKLTEVFVLPNEKLFTAIGSKLAGAICIYILVENYTVSELQKYIMQTVQKSKNKFSHMLSLKKEYETLTTSRFH